MPKYGSFNILPYPAESPVKETLEFLTDVIEAYDSTEQRIQLRLLARQSFDYSIPLKPQLFAEAFNAQYGAMRSNSWIVPYWAESQYVGDVANAATQILCQTQYYAFSHLAYALLANVCGSYQVVQINDVLSDRITLQSATTAAISSAFLMPARVGWIQGDIDMPTTGYNAKQSLTFVISDNPTVFASVPAQYNSNDIYFDIPFLANGWNENRLSQHQEIIDMSLGIVANRSHWTRPRYSKPWRFILRDIGEVWAFRDFFWRRAGKYRAFWFPTFDNNFRVTSTGTITSSIAVMLDSYSSYATTRTHIAIQVGETWYARTISSTTPLDPDHIQLNLDSSLGGIPADSIKRISYLGLHRLDTDRAELICKNGLTQVSLQVLELSP
jgi:hypothetical protein